MKNNIQSRILLCDQYAASFLDIFFAVVVL